MARTWWILKSGTSFLGPKFQFLAKKSDFCHTTPIFVDDPFLALDMTVNFPPWKRFFDFLFRSYSCFRKKIRLTAQKVFPPPTGQCFQIHFFPLETLHMGDNSSNSPLLPENKQLDQEKETFPFLDVAQGWSAPGTSWPSPRGTPRCRRRTAQNPLQLPARIPCNSCYAMPAKLKRKGTIVLWQIKYRGVSPCFPFV